MSRDPLRDYQDFLREDRRQRRVDAVMLWVILFLAFYGLGNIIIAVVGFVMAILG